MRKFITITIIAIIVVFCINISIFLNMLFGNNVVCLKKISEEDKTIIINVMNLSKVSDNIKLEKIETPKTYKDKYYKIYFEIDKNQTIIDNKSIINNDIYTDFKKIKTKMRTAKYSCTISTIGSNEALDEIMDKYRGL